MGNCIKASTRRRQGEADNREELHQAEKESAAATFKKGASLTVKVVLTKEELGWLMFELKVNEGKKLEDVLREIERRRSAKLVKAWKPSLDSIMESPEGA